jgi:hypothetical protein
MYLGMLSIGVGIAGISELSVKGAMLDSSLQSEAGGTGIAHDVTFRLAGGFRKVFERWGEGGEVAYGGGYSIFRM